jgi:hypothetical protein
MKNKMGILIAILLLLLGGAGFVVYKVLAPSKAAPTPEEEEILEVLPPVDASVVVEVGESKTKDNTVLMKVTGLGGKMVSVAYELTYDSQGLIKGVNSGSKPIDTAGQDGFEREIYLGTCSRNVCKPDVGVTKVSVVLEFTDTEGKRYSFSKEYDF